MDINLWIAFVIAATVILVIPGPTIILVISQAINQGKRSVTPLVLGVILGDLTCMTFSLLGLGAVLSASAVLFSIVKWLGAVYLIYLGIGYFRNNGESDMESMQVSNVSKLTLFKRSYVVTSLNPKGIAFFVAFLPQFVSPKNAMVPQLVILGMTFLILAGLNATIYGVFAGRLKDLMQNSMARKWVNRCGGSALIGAGIITAALKRA